VAKCVEKCKIVIYEIRSPCYIRDVRLQHAHVAIVYVALSVAARSFADLALYVPTARSHHHSQHSLRYCANPGSGLSDALSHRAACVGDARALGLNGIYFHGSLHNALIVRSTLGRARDDDVAQTDKSFSAQ